MNRFVPKTREADSAGADGQERELFVIDDYHSIPAGELRHILDGTGSWIRAVVRQKFGRNKPQPTYVIELRRMTRARHIPKRMEKHFDTLRRSLEALSFSSSFEATIPALGPYAMNIMGMSRRDGDVHALASRVTRQVAGSLVDDADLRFVSWLADGGVLVTSTLANQPRPRSGGRLQVVVSEDPGLVRKKHREGMRGLTVAPVQPADAFDHAAAEHREQVEDLLRRGIVRLATPAEVTRIRSGLRV